MRNKVKNIITMILLTVSLMTITGCSTGDFEYYSCPSCYSYIKKGDYICPMCGGYAEVKEYEFYSTKDTVDWKDQPRWTSHFEQLLKDNDVDRTTFDGVYKFMSKEENKEVVREALIKDRTEKGKRNN